LHIHTHRNILATYVPRTYVVATISTLLKIMCLFYKL